VAISCARYFAPMAIPRKPYGWLILSKGLPRPITRMDSGLEQGMMAVSLEEVQENFARYGLLDERVRFLKGYFNKTLPTAQL